MCTHGLFAVCLHIVWCLLHKMVRTTASSDLISLFYSTPWSKEIFFSMICCFTCQSDISCKADKFMTMLSKDSSNWEAISQEFWGEHVCIFKSLLSGKLNNLCDVKQQRLLLSPGRLLTVYRQLILAACHTGHAKLTHTYSHRHHYPFLVDSVFGLPMSCLLGVFTAARSRK